MGQPHDGPTDVGRPNSTVGKPTIYAFSDAAGTVPLVVSSLRVNLFHEITGAGNPYSFTGFAYSPNYHITMNGSSMVMTDVRIANDDSAQADYTDAPADDFNDPTNVAAAIGYVIKQGVCTSIATPDWAYFDWQLRASTDYTIIP